MDSNHFFLCATAYPCYSSILRTLYAIIFLILRLPIENLFLVENKGVEPLTLCVQGRCSSQLS